MDEWINEWSKPYNFALSYDAALFYALPVCMSFSHLAPACFSTPWAISTLPLLALALASSLAPCHLLQPKVSTTNSQNVILGSIMCISMWMVVMGWGIKCGKFNQ